MAVHIAQQAAIAAFSPEAVAVHEARRAAFREQRDFLLPRLRALGFDIKGEPQGAFYLYANCGKLTDDSYTFCLDVLPPAEAPGVSAPSGLGVPLHRAAGLLRTLVAHCRRGSGRDKLVLADVAELSPAHDTHDGRTARAAARIVYELAAIGR